MIYHGNFLQNMKFVSPLYKLPLKTENNIIRASTRKEYCLGFIFSWNNNLARMENKRYEPEKLLFTFDPSVESVLLKPCSIYTLEESSFKDGTQEFEKLSTNVVKVISEEKFESVYDCLKSFGNIVVEISRITFPGKFMGCCR